MMMVKIHF